MAARAANGQIAGPGASKASVETDYTKEDFRTAQLLNQDAPRSPFTMESQSGIMGENKNSGTQDIDRTIYKSVQYSGTVKVNGEVRDVSRKVYQRNDINIDFIDETTGMTNLERMQSGKPPIGPDGNPIQLHHILQKEVGPMVEIKEVTHQEYYSQLHGFIEDGGSFRNNPILNKQYNNFRYNYWKWRASQIVGGK